MVILILRLFSETLAELSLFPPIKTNSAAPLGLKYFVRLAAGIIMITILGKQSVDYMTGKRNILIKALTSNSHSSAIADHMTQTGHRIKWDHFDILATGPGGVRTTIALHHGRNKKSAHLHRDAVECRSSECVVVL